MTTKNEWAVKLAKLRWKGMTRAERSAAVPRNGGPPFRFIQCSGAKYHRFRRDGVCYHCGADRATLRGRN